MFKNPFGGGNFTPEDNSGTTGKLFGGDGKKSFSPRRKPESQTLFGMPPVPELKSTPPPVVTKTSTPERESQIFTSATTKSTVSNVFGARASPSPSSPPQIKRSSSFTSAAVPSKTLFGKSLGNPFGQPKAEPQVSFKGGVTDADAPKPFSLFGKGDPKPPDLFRDVATTRPSTPPNLIPTSSSASGLFGKPPPSFSDAARSSFQAPTTGLFGKPPPQKHSSLGGTEAPPPLFSGNKSGEPHNPLFSVSSDTAPKVTSRIFSGNKASSTVEPPKPLFSGGSDVAPKAASGIFSFNPGSSDAKKTNPFKVSTDFPGRTPEQRADLFKQPESHTGNLFKRDEAKESSFKISVQDKKEDEGARAVFVSKAPDEARGIFGTKPAAQAGGKPSAKSRLGTAPNIFKRTDTSSEPSGLFGKPRAPLTRSLFRKPVTDDASAFQEEDEDEGIENVGRRHSDEYSEGSEEGAKKRIERLTSKEELKDIKSIICENVPDIFLKKSILEKHFSRFGSVVKVLVNPRKQTATVHFSDHKGARLAKDKGKVINKQYSPIGAIFYSRTGSTRTGSKRKSSETDKAWRPDDVEDELHAMAGEPTNEYFLRSQGSAVFSAPKNPPAPLFTAPKHPTAPLFSAAPKQQLPFRKTDAAPPSYVPTASDQTEIRPKMDVSELMEILQRPAANEADRFNILEARDKLMREQRAQKDGETALVGTCPDICSEKERCGRAFKNQLKLYEKMGGVINHKATVKEYSRSSADQEVPLSHELRPARVLRKAMDHILCNVIDRVDFMYGTMEQWYDHVQAGQGTEFFGQQHEETSESIGDWFEFIWSATRGIRKDITQQQLTDHIAVALVEKCARFHIMCAERLVEEDSHNFASKLNDENLTKCLQTLKHMYYDLKLKDVKCANEPEFRSYDVLMNLNEGDTLRSVQTLDAWIRDSEPVRFAIKVFTAVNNNNYIRFFKLVRESTLLQGCIMLRYFNQVRGQALKTIVRAYCPAKSMVKFSLSKLRSMLGFEDDESCARCCSQHGIEAEVDSNTVYMERGMFRYPVDAPAMERARNLVESKRHVAWSEVVNGGPLPPNPYLSYRPHNSFDERGYLRREAWDASDQLVQISPAEQIRIELEEVIAGEVLDELLEETVEDSVGDIGDECITDMQKFEAAKEIVVELQAEIVKEVAEEIASASLREARNEEIQKRIHQEAKLSAGEDVRDDLIDSVIAEDVLEIAQEEMKVVEREKRLKQYYNVASDVIDDLYEEIKVGEIRKICELALEEAEQEREVQIQALIEKRRVRLLRQTFGSWLRNAKKKTRQKEILTNFPPGPPTNLSIQQQVERLSDGSVYGVEKALGRIKKNREEIEKLYNANEVLDALTERAILESFDLPNITGKILTEVFPDETRICWKLLVCVPTPDHESLNRAVCELIKRKLRSKHPHSDDDPNLLSCFSSPYDGRCISACIRIIDRDVLDEEIVLTEKKRREYLFGTSAILFVYITGEEAPEEAKDRLDQLLDYKPTTPPVPLVILTSSSERSNAVAAELDLESLVNKKAIASFNIVYLSTDIFDVRTIVSIKDSFELLLHKCPKPPTEGLSQKSLRDFVEDFVCQHVYQNMYTNLKERKTFGLPDQRPQVLIDLYNAAIDHLKSVLLKKSLAEISWPIPEFGDAEWNEDAPSYWNDVMYTDLVVDAMKILPLPPFKVKKEADWAEQCKMVLDYFDRIQRRYMDASFTRSRIQKALLKSYRAFERQSLLFWDGEVGTPSWELLPWTDIVQAFIEYKMTLLDTEDKFAVGSKEMYVCYFEKDHSDFSLPLKWALGHESCSTVRELVNESVTVMKEQSMGMTLAASTDTELLHDISVELDRSRAFEERLRSAVKEEGPMVTMEDKENQFEELYDREHVPVISYLSPTLGRMVSPMKVETRLEMHRTGKAPKHSPRSWRKRKAPATPEDVGTMYEERRSKFGTMIDDLKTKVQQDLNESDDFERRLEEALK